MPDSRKCLALTRGIQRSRFLCAPGRPAAVFSSENYSCADASMRQRYQSASEFKAALPGSTVRLAQASQNIRRNCLRCGGTVVAR